MIRIACPYESEKLEDIVIAAFQRSFGVGGVQSLSYTELARGEAFRTQPNSKYEILVLVSPPEECTQLIIHILEITKAKIILFGIVPSTLAKFLNMQVAPISAKVVAASECRQAPIYQFCESFGYIHYIKGLGEGSKALPLRAMRRYDYANEWNNLGFGAITTDGTIWSLSNCADVLPQNTLAYLITDDEKLSDYCAVWNYSHASLLWFNREVGPIDSYEWRLVEIFVSQYRFHDLPAWPVLLEIPYGYDSAVTMRLDCDEDIESARSLFYAYKSWGIPFSLALKASILVDPRQHKLPRDVMADGGAILSHTLTHAPNWGGSKADAMYEGLESAHMIYKAINVMPLHAVSPFHQTPLYARLGLAEANYKSCIGGIIANDPDFIMARGGRPPFSDSGFIGHTQQCMLHGDCLLETGDPLATYKRAFDQSLVAKTLFGYLDHPFSERYQYGWSSEEDRIEAHNLFINHIQMSSNNIIFLNENDALNFLYLKSHINIEETNEIKITPPPSSVAGLTIAVEFGNKIYRLDKTEIIL
jgi:hypothetical protein